jgi:hypothetical protein
MRRTSMTEERRGNIVDDFQSAVALVYDVMTYKTAEATRSCHTCGGPVVRGKRSLLKQVFCKPVFWCVRCIKIVE